MRTSNKIVAVAAAAVALAVAIGIVGIRVYVDRLIERSGGELSTEEITGSDEVAEQSFAAEGFSRVAMSGGWHATIERGDDFSVRLRGPEKYLERTNVEVDGDTLTIQPEAMFITRGARMRVSIVMPDLEGVRSNGGLELEMRGFSGDTLELSCRGGTSVEASGEGYERIDMDFSGGTEVDFREFPAVDADIRSSGAVDAVLTMKGGVLSGKLSGAGSVIYYGSVREQSIETEGVAEIKRGR